MKKMVRIIGAKANNLKNVSLNLHFGELTAFAGPSGSGKTSMAFDVLYNYASGKENIKVDKILDIPKHVIAINQRIESATLRMETILKAIKILSSKTLVIIDEPCAGLTRRDATSLAGKLKKVAKGGHIVVVVDHRIEILRQADRVFVFGPKSGPEGGEIVTETTGNKFALNLKIPEVKRAFNSSKLKLISNFSTFQGIKNYNIEFPIKKLTSISGNIGSGKTTFLECAFVVCDKSAGAGPKRISMLDVKGKQYLRRPHMITSSPVTKNSRSTLVSYYGISSFLKNKDLDITVSEAILKYKNNKLLIRRLEWLSYIGLDYLILNQPSYTLSGGECQRVKLAKMLSKKLGDRSLYIFDNPCRGLGIDNIKTLMLALDCLVKNNNTVLIAENDPTALKYVDHIIELKN